MVEKYALNSVYFDLYYVLWYVFDTESVDEVHITHRYVWDDIKASFLFIFNFQIRLTTKLVYWDTTMILQQYDYFRQ